jgi:2-oxoglutarate/2-oxoacid ferredoxin oxidoreductase subunit alpha
MLQSAESQDRLNDFVIKLANVNGTGSASANSLLMKSIFRMGIPVMGKNYFPSNIQGLPTWYEIRATRQGYVARSGRVDIMVAMNAETYAKDLKEVSPGGYLVYDSTWPRSAMLKRDDITIFGVPLARMCNETFQGVRARILLKNVMYAGVLAALLDIEIDTMRTLLNESYSTKKALLDSNVRALEMGYEYAKTHFACPLPLRVQRMDKTSKHIMIDGNTAAALGCLYAGATVGVWYPITPSTSLMDAFKGFCQKWRIDPETGKRNYVIVQAEDELAAIGAVLGASWNGARSFTPTSGPGISLMNEFIGLAYYAEIPAVIFDVQRVGPSTGMPTRTQQCDILLAAYASHGDTRHVLLFPNSPEECFYLSVQAFDLAERLQTPVFVMTDLDIGMNDWMCPTLEWDDSYRPDRGKVLSKEQIEQLDKFYRYMDRDGDAIPYRTLPGVHPRGAYFTRGSGHTQYGGYTEDSTEYQIVLDRLKRKFDTAKKLVPAAVFRGRDTQDIGIVSFGSCDGAVCEALDLLDRRGIQADYMRVRSFPFGEEVEAFLANHSVLFVVEQNRDAQLRSLLTLETAVEKSKLRSILHYSGLPMASTVIVDGVLNELGLAPPELAAISGEAVLDQPKSASQSS